MASSKYIYILIGFVAMFVDSVKQNSQTKKVGSIWNPAKYAALSTKTAAPSIPVRDKFKKVLFASKAFN